MKVALIFLLSLLSTFHAFGDDRVETLEAIMNHPKDPNYDVLRPMSGRWARCRSSVDDPSGSAGLQDIFSSSDHSHFSRTLVKTSASDCTSPISAERRSYECDSLAKETLKCRLTKVETKAGSRPDDDSGWASSTLSESDIRKGALTISLKNLGPKKKHKAPATDDTRKLEVRITHADALSAGDAESIILQFQNPRPPSSAVVPASSSHH